MCGHEFTGHGVIWKEGILFCNASLQLTSKFPSVQSTNPNPTIHQPNFEEPHLWVSKGSRPRRWKRKLPKLLYQLFVSNGKSHCSKFLPSIRNPTNLIVRQTKSSLAATEQTNVDTGFIYDPEMRADVGLVMPVLSENSATSIAYASATNPYLSNVRRNPVVIDVYVVNDDENIILPNYSTGLSSNLET